MDNAYRGIALTKAAIEIKDKFHRVLHLSDFIFIAPFGATSGYYSSDNHKKIKDFVQSKQRYSLALGTRVILCIPIFQSPGLYQILYLQMLTKEAILWSPQDNLRSNAEPWIEAYCTLYKYQHIHQNGNMRFRTIELVPDLERFQIECQRPDLMLCIFATVADFVSNGLHSMEHILHSTCTTIGPMFWGIIEADGSKVPSDSVEKYIQTYIAESNPPRRELIFWRPFDFNEHVRKWDPWVVYIVEKHYLVQKHDGEAAIFRHTAALLDVDTKLSSDAMGLEVERRIRDLQEKVATKRSETYATAASSTDFQSQLAAKDAELQRERAKKQALETSEQAYLRQIKNLQAQVAAKDSQLNKQMQDLSLQNGWVPDPAQSRTSGSSNGLDETAVKAIMEEQSKKIIAALAEQATVNNVNLISAMRTVVSEGGAAPPHAPFPSRNMPEVDELIRQERPSVEDFVKALQKLASALQKLAAFQADPTPTKVFEAFSAAWTAYEGVDAMRKMMLDFINKFYDPAAPTTPTSPVPE
jgi:hypothetical protein